MQEINSSSKTFHGITFVLHGPDSDAKAKVCSTLIHGGAVDATQCGLNNSHVIVDKMEYDDPLCVEARTAGKTVVTFLWVEHSLEVGVAVDPNSVIYRPLRNLAGIPGAKTLIMCLTGYQRQDRDDIMTMVRLMGAQFSKPLVANKVTHLICYKFEGEKYELARRLKRIRLVNHRWLEDCLKEWKMLSEESYSKSGQELEMEEVEAKDSDEDADTKAKPASQQALDDLQTSLIRTDAFKSPCKMGQKGGIDAASFSPDCQTKSSVNSVSTQLKAANDTKDLLEEAVKTSEVMPCPESMTSIYTRKTPPKPSKRILSDDSPSVVSFRNSNPDEASENHRKVSHENNLLSSRGDESSLKFNEQSRQPSTVSVQNKDLVYSKATKEREQSPQPSLAELGIEEADDYAICQLSAGGPVSDLHQNNRDISIGELFDVSKDSNSAGSGHESSYLPTIVSQDAEVRVEHELQNHNQSSALSSLAKPGSEQTNTCAKLNQSGENDVHMGPKTRVKKLAVKRTLGSRPKINKATNQKGSIPFGKSRIINDTSASRNENASDSGITIQKKDSSLSDTDPDLKEVEAEVPEEKNKKRKVLAERNLESVSGNAKKLQKKAQVGAKSSAIHEKNLESYDKENETTQRKNERKKKLRKGPNEVSNVTRVSKTDEIRTENHENTRRDKKSGSTTPVTNDENRSAQRKTRSSIQKVDDIKSVDDLNPAMAEKNNENALLESSKDGMHEQRPRTDVDVSNDSNEPKCFIFSGAKLLRKEFQKIVKGLKGKCGRDCHQWSYQATHYIASDPLRRTEKFFAATASGRWILKMDYLTACAQAGRFLPEEPYEWHDDGMSEDGAISLDAPRKWRLLKSRTGHGAFHGMRIVIYGECIAPSLDTLKRVIKAGDGSILATSPPYTRFFKSVIDYAVISPGMPKVDLWVQEFLKNEIPCVSADYLVDYVCKPGQPLEAHVLFGSNGFAEKSLKNLLSKAQEIVDR